jgi:cysteine desulfuration protein SufE
MFESCLNQQNQVIELFKPFKTPDDLYNKIIELGKEQKTLDDQFKTTENLVKGCQSKMYLHAFKKDGLIFFETDSDALISKGLGVLLTMAYSGQTSEAILKCPPDFLNVIGIASSLSPSRSNGLFSLHLKMKQEALKLLLTP